MSAQREAPRPELGNERASGDEAELENGRLPDNGTALKDGRKPEKDAVSGNGPAAVFGVAARPRAMEYRPDMRAAFRAFFLGEEQAFWEPAGRRLRAVAKASGGRRRISGCGFPAHNSCVR